MKRYTGYALIVGLLFLGITISATSKAQLVFSFSVDNTVGSVGGTFAGEIFGLTDNATSSATSVVIESFPAGLNSLVAAPVEATLWDQQDQNSFTVSGGQITAGGFWAEQTIGGFPEGYQLYINGGGGPFNFLNLDGTDKLFVWGDNGIKAANFVNVSPTGTPEPGSVALLAGIFLCGAAVRKRRIRK